MTVQHKLLWSIVCTYVQTIKSHVVRVTKQAWLELGITPMVSRWLVWFENLYTSSHLHYRKGHLSHNYMQVSEHHYDCALWSAGDVLFSLHLQMPGVLCAEGIWWYCDWLQFDFTPCTNINPNNPLRPRPGGNGQSRQIMDGGNS